jgi:glycosyltransferase involved in cell wall biosynthesis
MTGGPQNLYNLLSQLSTDSYCILTGYEMIRRAETTGRPLAGEYFFYDHRGSVQEGDISESVRTRRNRAANMYEFLLALARRTPSFASRMVEAALQAFYLLLSILMILPVGVRIVRRRNIRCIMGISDVGPALISTYLISRFTGIPYVLYFFDIYLGNNLLPLNDIFARIFEPRMLRDASMVILTNEGAERFYRERYGDTFKCTVVHNSILTEAYESKRTPYDPTEPYTVLFTGHVYWAQERSLMNFIRALSKLRDLPLRFEVYAPRADETFRRSVATCDNVHLTKASQSEMPDVQCRATMLFLPLSWHTRSPGIISTATPSKLVDYLASGRPMLIHAPPYAYVSEYAKREEFAEVVDEENIDKLSESVRKLIFDVQYSRRLIENAERTLYKNHDAVVNAKKLADALESLVAVMPSDSV